MHSTDAHHLVVCVLSQIICISVGQLPVAEYIILHHEPLLYNISSVLFACSFFLDYAR